MAFPYVSDLVRALTGLDLPLPLPMFGLAVAAAFLVSLRMAAREILAFAQSAVADFERRAS